MNSAALILATGLGAGFSLIIAIGAQNAFVLRQGLTRRHTGWVVALCAISDAVLIAAGVLGIGVVIETLPSLVTVIRVAGGIFLLCYAAMAARRVVKGGSLEAAALNAAPGLGATLATCLALTWLNPHVYLDTVVLLGSIANSHPNPDRWILGAGAMIASLVWFTALGFGARLLGPLFARPGAWRLLDGVIALVMATLGVLMLVTS